MVKDSGHLPFIHDITQISGHSVVGLIDIGSNSIRLVVYRAGGRLPHPQFNEREVCRLGAGLNETGRLADDRIHHALSTLRRFQKIIEASHLHRLDVFATEATRRASNASDFVAAAEAILKVPIRILSGLEEARFAGKGVLSGFVDVDGIVGDLGGGSLDLIHMNNHGSAREKPAASLACGYLIPHSKDALAAMIDGQTWLQDFKDRPFYAVGGTWRAIATAYTAASKKRVDVIHGLTLKPDELAEITAEIMAADGELAGVPKSRRSSMGQALAVLSVLFDRLTPSKIIFSSYGAREGILYDDLSQGQRRIDPLMAGVMEFAAMTERFQGLGAALVKPLMAFIDDSDPHLQRLAIACCYLADISWLDHPDYRASLAIEKMFGLSVVGLDHADRAWMAAVLSTHYTGAFPKRKFLHGLLTDKERQAAKFVGLTLRMLMTVSGGIPKLLRRIDVCPKGGAITLAIPRDLCGLEGGLVASRIDAIKGALLEHSNKRIDFVMLD